MKATIVTLAFGLSLAAAAPVPELASRGPNEALYLVNCFGQGRQHSEMAYYANGKSGSQHQEAPDDVAVVNSDNTVQWEGNAITGKFSKSGATATSYINSNAGSIGFYKFAGTARNSYGQNFNCYKDNSRTVFPTSVGSCYSQYYCFDA